MPAFTIEYYARHDHLDVIAVSTEHDDVGFRVRADMHVEWHRGWDAEVFGPVRDLSVATEVVYALGLTADEVARALPDAETLGVEWMARGGVTRARLGDDCAI